MATGDPRPAGGRRDPHGRGHGRGGATATPISLLDLLMATLRSPRELAGILVSIFVAAILVSPLPPAWQGVVGILLAAIPGTFLLHRVRRRLERDREDPDSPGRR